MAQIPPSVTRPKPAGNPYANIQVVPKVQPTVSYVRPDGPAPQGKFGSPNAMGFSPAYTSSVPKSEPSIWSQALTKVGGQVAASFLQSPYNPVQQLAYNSTIGSLASPEFLMNNNLSPLRGMDPSFKPTWQEAIQAPLDAAGFMAAPMFTLGLAGADAAGVKNIAGNTLLGTGAIVTAVNVWKNKGNPVAAVKALGPMVNALGFGVVSNWVQENTGVNIHGLAPWFLQKANTLGPYPEKPWPRQEYWQDATKQLTDTQSFDPYWRQTDPRFEPQIRSNPRVKANGGGVMEDFNFETGKWIERVPRPTWMQQFMQNFRNAITPQWKMQDPVKPSYNPLQITTTKPPPKIGDRYTPPPMNPNIPPEHRPRYDDEGRLTTEYLQRELKNRDDWTTIDPESTYKPWEFLKSYIEKFPDSVNPESQKFLDDFWKTVRENPTLDQFKIWEIMTDDTGSTIRGKPWPPVNPDVHAYPKGHTKDPWANITYEQNDAWLNEQKSKLDIPKEIKNRDNWTEIDPESIPPWEFLKNSPERDFTDQVFLSHFWNAVKENPTLDPYKIWEVMSDNKNEVLTGKPSPKKSLDTYIDPLGNEWDSKDQWDHYQQSIQDYAARQELSPMQESVEDATRRLAAQMAEGGERPVSYYQELLRQSFKTFEDLTNAGTDFNRFPTDVTPNKWIEDNNTFLPSMMGKDNLPMSGFGASTSPSNDVLESWDYKQRPPNYFDEYGNFVENNPLRSMGNETLKTLPMGQLGVSAQIQLRRDIFMGADLDKLPEPTKKAIYESFDMGWHTGLGDDGEYDTGNYMVEGYPLMEYINSPESSLPNLADYLVPTGQDAQGRMTFEGDYYKWEQDFRKAWRDNPGLFRDRKLHPEFLPEWANPRYRDNSGE